jgi:hypothetical protein
MSGDGLLRIFSGLNYAANLSLLVDLPSEPPFDGQEAATSNKEVNSNRCDSQRAAENDSEGRRT